MKIQRGFAVGALVAMLAMLLITPTLVQAKGEMGMHYKEMKMEMVKQLKLTPDKEKAFMEVDDKFAAERQQIIATLKKAQEDLDKAVAAAKPDQEKIKSLVSALTAGQDNLFTSFRNQRDAELALLSPLEQGKYLVAMSQWRHKMMEQCVKEISGKEKKKEAGKKK